VNFGVAYGSDVSLLKNVCMGIMTSDANIEKSPAPQVLFQDFGDSNLNFSLIFHSNMDRVSSLIEIRSSVRFQIDEKFRQHKIEMAFPQRDLNFKLKQPIDVKVLS
jgi:small-conductance mechanosensitive channel